MAYAYEDEDELLNDEENEEELDANLNVKKKTKSKSVKVQEVSKDNDKLSVEDLLASDGENHEYSIDNLLKEEQPEEEKITWDNLLTKKDDKLFRLYLSSGYEKITSKTLNYAALILGPIYLLYRKVYMVGFVWLFLNLFALLLPLAKVNYVIVIIFEVISFICSGVFANQIILNHVGSKILNYKMVEDNKEKLKAMCEKKGGTNLILASIVFLIISSGACMMLWGQITKLIMPEKTKEPSIKTEDKVYFNGKINIDKNIKIRDNVSILVPDNFYLANENEYQYYYVYQDPNAYMPLCSIELDKVIGYKNPDLLISAITSYHLELDENIGTKSVNNYTWKYINVLDANKYIYYATTTINDDMYLLKFTYQDKLEKACGSHFEEIINSIK